MKKTGKSRTIKPVEKTKAYALGVAEGQLAETMGEEEFQAMQSRRKPLKFNELHAYAMGRLDVRLGNANLPPGALRRQFSGYNNIALKITGPAPTFDLTITFEGSSYDDRPGEHVMMRNEASYTEDSLKAKINALAQEGFHDPALQYGLDCMQRAHTEVLRLQKLGAKERSSAIYEDIARNLRSRPIPGI